MEFLSASHPYGLFQFNGDTREEYGQYPLSISSTHLSYADDLSGMRNASVRFDSSYLIIKPDNPVPGKKTGTVFPNDTLYRIPGNQTPS
jgi:hypothetical protein